tara:strand:+ start:618 stop:1007 length:390 start_codon:yes stop_codon:yes gene_type:complete
MSYLIRFQNQGERQERSVCCCPVLSDARYLAFVISKTKPNAWVRIYKQAPSTNKGRLTHDVFDGGVLVTNDRVHTHALMDDCTIPPLSLVGKVGVVNEVMSTPVNVMRRGKGRYKVVKNKVLTRHGGKS